ncbi:degenerin mec-10-like isoform X2 [Tigriopus californicus]|nr:degenerin mec-10-like isoform X2 [Tigriopus californicus]
MKMEREKQLNQSSNFHITCPDQFLKLNNTEDGNIEDDSLFDEVYGQLQQTDRQRIGMERKVMVKLCTINHSPCSGYFDAQTINTVSRGNCFGFNYNGSFQVRAGPEEGMSLEFFLVRNESVWHSMNNKVGLRVVLHQPNEVPLIEELGRDVFPGAATSFSLQIRQNIRQPAPYPSKCIDSWNETFFTTAKFPIVANWKYSQVGCSRMCFLQHFMQNCDCIYHNQDDMNIKEYHQNQGIPPFEYCSMKNQTSVDCLGSSYNTYNSDKCRCQPNCNETIYEIGTSALTWPSESGWFYKAIEFNMTSSYKDDQPITSDDIEKSETELYPIYEEIKKNLLRLDFYFSSQSRIVIEELPVYADLFSLFANLGGALSLWMGISFLALIEVIEVVIDSVMKTVQ